VISKTFFALVLRWWKIKSRWVMIWWWWQGLLVVY